MYNENKIVCRHCLYYLDCVSFFIQTIMNRFMFGEARFCVSPVLLIENKGLKNKDLNLAAAIIEENKEIIIERWNEYFNK